MQDCRSRRQGLRSVWVIVMYSWARHFPFTMPLSTQECKWVQTGLDFGTVGPHGSSADLCKQFSFNAVHRYQSLVRGKNTFSRIFCIIYFLLSHIFFLPSLIFCISSFLNTSCFRNWDRPLHCRC